MNKLTKKRLTAVLMCLLTALPGMAASEGPPLILSAEVTARRETAVKAPVSGETEPFTLLEGQSVQAGEALLTIAPKRAYAAIDGTVADVYVSPGDIASAATARYGAVMRIERENRYELNCNYMTGNKGEDNRNIYVGTRVYLRSANEKHFADGVITHAEGRAFTVEVIGGDIEFDEDVKVYKSPGYEDKFKLARASMTPVPPADVTASGTIISLAVSRGDAVKKGDLLFTYVPDELDAPERFDADICTVRAQTGGCVASVPIAQGAAVTKGQALLLMYEGMRLRALVFEADVGLLYEGRTARVSFDELSLPPVMASISMISSIGEGEGGDKYAVYLDFADDAAPDGVRYGMHATIEFQAET